MSVIKPRTRGKEIVRHIAHLDRENNETLYAYAHFLGKEPTDYVLNQLVESVLAKDKEFVIWRQQHSESFVPQRVARTRKARRAGATFREHAIQPTRARSAAQMADEAAG